MTATAPAHPGTGHGLLVVFDGGRVLDRDGRLLAELADDGHWYTASGDPCEGLTLPAPIAASRVAGGERSEQQARADELWHKEAAKTVAAIASRQEFLTSDDLWAALRTPPRQSKMIGNALSKAKAAGVIAPTGQHRASKRGQNHGRPILIWRSLGSGQQSLSSAL
jgi:hypothetical protein